MQAAAETLVYNALHAGVGVAATTAHTVVGAGVQVAATPAKIATAAATSVAVTLTANALFWTGKAAVHAGWWLGCTAASGVVTVASATADAACAGYRYFFPPPPKMIEWHKTQETQEPYGP